MARRLNANPFLVNDNLADAMGRSNINDSEVAFRAGRIVIAWDDQTNGTIQGQAYSWDNTLRPLGGNFSISAPNTDYFETLAPSPGISG